MSLIEKISADQVQARKDKDTLRATLLTTLLGEAAKKGKDQGVPTNEKGLPLTSDVDVIAVVKKFRDGATDTIGFLGTNNPEATQVCKDEIAILETYLPRQMTQEQIKGAILVGMRDQPVAKGPIMAYLKKNFAGQYDGKEASAVVDAIINTGATKL